MPYLIPADVLRGGRKIPKPGCIAVGLAGVGPGSFITIKNPNRRINRGFETALFTTSGTSRQINNTKEVTGRQPSLARREKLSITPMNSGQFLSSSIIVNHSPGNGGGSFCQGSTPFTRDQHVFPTPRAVSKVQLEASGDQPTSGRGDANGLGFKAMPHPASRVRSDHQPRMVKIHRPPLPNRAARDGGCSESGECGPRRAFEDSALARQKLNASPKFPGR